MKEKKICLVQILFMLLCGIVMILGVSRSAFADVAVGDVIDKTNWQKAQGLLPDVMLEYLQKGYFTIKIGKLNYDPAGIWSNDIKESQKKNIGRYTISANQELVDKKTGEVVPMDVVGVSFPDADPKDPSYPLMTIYNHMYMYNSRSNAEATSTMYFVGKKMERYIGGPNMLFSLIGSPKSISQQPAAAKFGKKLGSILIFKVTDPYELNGLATMSYSYIDMTPDKVFAYVPALRRVRTMSAASRSDAMFGTDYTIDDISCFAGKPEDFKCKYIRRQEALVRYQLPDIVELTAMPDGSYQQKKAFQNTQWGFQTPGWQGKPWSTSNSIWVKRKVDVIECSSKDPYYNYGKFELWYDPLTYCYAHKIIWDRAGKRWKVMNSGFGAIRTKDGKIGVTISAFGDWIYDEQRDHATCIDEHNTKEKYILYQVMTPETFTIGGLTQFAK